MRLRILDVELRSGVAKPMHGVALGIADFLAAHTAVAFRWPVRPVAYHVPALVLLLSFCSAASTWAQDANPAHGADTEAVARAAMTQLRSPVTPSHTLDMCPAVEAAALRDTVLLAAAAGEPVNQIVEDVIARRGEQLRIVPRKRGFALWAWLAPAVVLFGGGAVVMARLRSLRLADVPPAEASGGELSTEDRTELAAALREWERTEAEA